MNISGSPSPNPFGFSPIKVPSAKDEDIKIEPASPQGKDAVLKKISSDLTLPASASPIVRGRAISLDTSSSKVQSTLKKTEQALSPRLAPIASPKITPLDPSPLLEVKQPVMAVDQAKANLKNLEDLLHQREQLLKKRNFASPEPKKQIDVEIANLEKNLKLAQKTALESEKIALGLSSKKFDGTIEPIKHNEPYKNQLGAVENNVRALATLHEGLRRIEDDLNKVHQAIEKAKKDKNHSKEERLEQLEEALVKNHKEYDKLIKDLDRDLVKFADFVKNNKIFRFTLTEATRNQIRDMLYIHVRIHIESMTKMQKLAGNHLLNNIKEATKLREVAEYHNLSFTLDFENPYVLTYAYVEEYVKDPTVKARVENKIRQLNLVIDPANPKEFHSKIKKLIAEESARKTG